MSKITNSHMLLNGLLAIMLRLSTVEARNSDHPRPGHVGLSSDVVFNSGTILHSTDVWSPTSSPSSGWFYFRVVLKLVSTVKCLSRYAHIYHYYISCIISWRQASVCGVEIARYCQSLKDEHKWLRRFITCFFFSPCASKSPRGKKNASKRRLS